MSSDSFTTAAVSQQSTQADCSHFHTDWQRFANHCHLVYSCWQLASMLQSIRVSLLAGGFTQPTANMLHSGSIPIEKPVFAATICRRISISECNRWQSFSNFHRFITVYCHIVTNRMKGLDNFATFDPKLLTNWYQTDSVLLKVTPHFWSNQFTFFANSCATVSNHCFLYCDCGFPQNENQAKGSIWNPSHVWRSPTFKVGEAIEVYKPGPRTCSQLVNSLSEDEGCQAGE